MKQNKISGQLKKLFAAKGFGMVAIGLIAGLLLLLMPNASGEESQVSSDMDSLTSAEYCALLEQKAVLLITELPEVDECSVFITLESGFRYIYATDQHVYEQSDSKQTDKTIVLAGNGNGESPILIEETMPKVAGVAVVCGGASYETQYRIIELMCALFDINSSRISVLV